MHSDVAGMPVLINFKLYSPKHGEEDALFMHLLLRCKGRWCFRVKGRQDIFDVIPFKFKVQFKVQFKDQ